MRIFGISALLSLLIACPMYSQSSPTNPISGHIRDSSGKSIPNVKVALVYRPDAVVSTVYSDTEGNFEIAANGLKKEITEYGLRFEKEGFAQLQLKYAKSSEIILITPAEQNTEIGDYYSSIGNDVAAIGRYKEAIKLQPGYQAANDGLGRSLERMGPALERIGKYEEAIAVYQDFIARFPDSPAVAEYKARILKIQNKKY